MHVVLTCTTLPHTPTHIHTYKCLLLTVCVREDVIGFHFCHSFRIEMAEAGHHSLKHTRSGHHTTKRKALLSAKTHLIHPPNVPTILQRDLKSVKRERKKEREKRVRKKERERGKEKCIPISPLLSLSPQCLYPTVKLQSPTGREDATLWSGSLLLLPSLSICLSVCHFVPLSWQGQQPPGLLFYPSREHLCLRASPCQYSPLLRTF